MPRQPDHACHSLLAKLPERAPNEAELTNGGLHLEGVQFDRFSDSEGFAYCQRKIKIYDEVRADPVDPGPMSPR